VSLFLLNDALIRHRPSLLKYHKRHLRLGESLTAPSGSPLASTSQLNLKALAMTTVTAPAAQRGWQLTVLDTKSEEGFMELDQEIAALEMVLGSEVGEWEARLHAVKSELSR
jgi:ATP-binding cassette subfamily D (ALD) long-chain fatty acid import protein